MSANSSMGPPERKEVLPFQRTAGAPPQPRVAGANADPQPVPQAPNSLAVCWHVLWKRRETIAAVALLVSVAVAIVSFRMKPVYKSTARVEVESEAPLTQAILELNRGSHSDDAFLQTQIQLLKSDNLAWRTIGELQLSQNAAFIDAKRLSRAGAEERKFLLIKQFRDHLTLELVPRTRMLLVSYESPEPRLAAEIATTLVNNYLEYNFSKRYESTRQASGWMEQQLDELKAKVEQSQQVLVDYEKTHQIASTSEKQNVAEQMLSDLSRVLTTAQSERIQKESLYQQVTADRPRIAWLAHDDLLQKLEERGAELQGLYTEAVNQYGPKFPKALRLQQELQQNQGQVEREQTRVVERIRRDYDSAAKREKLAATAVARQKEAVAALNQLLIQRNILERDFEANQQLYQNLLQRLKNATVTAGLRSTNIHLVDNALPPTMAVRPKRALNIVLGLLAGIILGIITAFAQESLDSSIKTAEEVEGLLPNPLLAAIPLDRPASLLGLRGGSRRRSPEETLALSIKQRPRSRLAEAYRILGTSVLLPGSANSPRNVLVTSSQAGEGKTVTALNLAQALAQRRGPVLILDCDLRKGGVAPALGISNDKGLSSLLTGGAHLDEVLTPCAEEPRLWVLPSGPAPPNPAELLAGDAMPALLEKLASRFERTVIDSPPVLAVTDATILSSLADGVVLVAESGGTPRAALVRSHRTLENAGARILGVALNKFDPRRHGYYDGSWMSTAADPQSPIPAEPSVQFQSD
jgi:succinoglycan biosynthesis transport protein ExoP